MKRHRSATAIVREFLGPQLAVIPEELVWIPAHPSYPDDGGFTYDEMLKAVRQQKHWAFVRVPKEKNVAAVIHFWAAKDVAPAEVARMLGHELGHISGEILEDEAAEEERADRYGAVAEQVLRMLTGQKAATVRTPSRSSRAGKASRQAHASSKARGAVRPSPQTAPTPALVQVRKRPKG